MVALRQHLLIGHPATSQKQLVVGVVLAFGVGSQCIIPALGAFGQALVVKLRLQLCSAIGKHRIEALAAQFHEARFRRLIAQLDRLVQVAGEPLGLVDAQSVDEVVVFLLLGEVPLLVWREILRRLEMRRAVVPFSDLLVAHAAVGRNLVGGIQFLRRGRCREVRRGLRLRGCDRIGRRRSFRGHLHVKTLPFITSGNPF